MSRPTARWWTTTSCTSWWTSWPSSDYLAGAPAIAAFNASSPVLKKGLALTPLKFGISVQRRAPSTRPARWCMSTPTAAVLVNHGGTEMGQGLNTKVAQVVAHELGLPLAAVRCDGDRHAEGGQHLGHRRQHRQPT
jgi:xanthine dehydrogenase molybdopterin-binding subunit B